MGIRVDRERRRHEPLVGLEVMKACRRSSAVHRLPLRRFRPLPSLEHEEQISERREEKECSYPECPDKRLSVEAGAAKAVNARSGNTM